MYALDFLNLSRSTSEKESGIRVVLLHSIFWWKQMDIFSMKNNLWIFEHLLKAILRNTSGNITHQKSSRVYI